MAAADISSEEYARWIPIRDALGQVAEVMHFPNAAIAIGQRLKAGLIVAAAESVVGGRSGKERADYVKVPPAHWAANWVTNSASTFWSTGQMTASQRTAYRDSPVSHTYFGLRLDPDGLAKLLPQPKGQLEDTLETLKATSRRLDKIQGASEQLDAILEARRAQPQPPASQRERHGGGRPPLAFWEDAILTIAQRIHLGDFKPTRQADVQRALAEYLAEHGFEAGDTATKERAKKLWDTFKD